MQQAAEKHWKNRLDLPAYRVGEAASYAKISPQTVAAWHKRTLEGDGALLSYKKAREGLSFRQLIELAVVSDMRRAGVKLAEIKRARDYLAATTGLAYPFAQLRFKTDGADILHDVEGPLGRVLNDRLLASNHTGQFVWRQFLSERLREFNYDDDGAVSLWKVAGQDKDIEIDPRVAFGAPQVDGVKTAILKAKFGSGQEVDELADDFGLDATSVVEALLFEGLSSENPRLSKWIN